MGSNTYMLLSASILENIKNIPTIIKSAISTDLKKVQRAICS